jgi:hypothetical protein
MLKVITLARSVTVEHCQVITLARSVTVEHYI